MFKQIPPFTKETAIKKVRLAENAWNSCNPEKVSLAYSLNSRWRNRDQFINGRSAIISFLTNKWKKELEYRLIKELWAYSDNRIGVRFAYEWHDHKNQWYRSYGNECWAFDSDGLMYERYASINDISIRLEDRLFFWECYLPRPENYKSLSEFGL